MFNGTRPLEKFKREHLLADNRFCAAGERESHIVAASSRPMTLGSQIVGFTRRLIGGG
jgi:hypothetical protein